MEKLSIKRNNSFNHKLRKIRIISNNSDLIEIKDGEEKEVEITNGKQIIFAKIDWVKSNLIEINIEENYEYTLFLKTKKPKYRTAKLVFALLLFIVINLPVVQRNELIYIIMNSIFILYCTLGLSLVFYNISNSLSIRIEKNKC